MHRFIPPIAALAPDITVYVSGLSKSVATGLRVGFVSGSVSTAEPFATSEPVPQALRLALGSIELRSLAQTLRKVREVVDADPFT
jgi:aspartate/methionine/tyrosine aminotransferase